MWALTGRGKGDIWDKVQEELEELKVELAQGRCKNYTELWEFLFSVINAAVSINSILTMPSKRRIRS